MAGLGPKGRGGVLKVLIRRGGLCERRGRRKDKRRMSKMRRRDDTLAVVR